MTTYHLASGKPAVELSFALEFEDDILYCGHLDRVVEYTGQHYVMDQKAQPLTTKVLTPTGWVPIKDLQLGSPIATQNGSFTTVEGIYPKGVTPVYRVKFNDGTAVECADDHLWTVGTQFSDKFQTLNLKDLLNQPAYKKWHVPLCEPVQHPEAPLPLEPYLLGLLLGNGYLTGTSIQLSTSVPRIAKKAEQLLPSEDRIKKASKHNYSWTISGGKTKHALALLKLLKPSAGKFIPDLYKFASVEQRQALLQGLLDTDGSWNGKSCIYDSTSKQLVTDLCELVRSLGGTARYRDRRDTAYRVSLRMPDLPTGVGRRYIAAIERMDDAETACISVAHPSGLYITENHTVTHNTAGSTLGPYYFAQFSPNNQMSGYTWAGQSILKSPIKGVIIDAAQIAVNFTEFGRSITTRTQAQLDEWHASAVYTIRLAQSATSLNRFPMNLSSCGNYGGCPFRQICGADPRVRESYIKSDYVPHNWDPLKER